MKPLLCLAECYWVLFNVFSKLSPNKLPEQVLIRLFNIFFLQTLQNVLVNLKAFALGLKKVVGSNHFCCYVENWILTQIKSSQIICSPKAWINCFLFFDKYWSTRVELMFIFFCFCALQMIILTRTDVFGN